MPLVTLTVRKPKTPAFKSAVLLDRVTVLPCILAAAAAAPTTALAHPRHARSGEPMRWKRARSAAAALVVAISIAVSGCSVISVRGPARPPGEGGRAPGETPCTTSQLAPALDTVVASTGAGLSVLLLVDSARPCPQDSMACGLQKGLDLAILLPAATATVVYGSSAVYGYVKTGACRRQLSLSSGGAHPAALDRALAGGAEGGSRAEARQEAGAPCVGLHQGR
jgi:hypothetical protein